MAEAAIRTATPSDEAAIAAVLLLAFSTDPATRWTWPEPQQYLEHFPKFIKALGGNAFAHDSAYYVEGYAGAALWLPPGLDADAETLSDLMQRTASASAKQDVLAVVEQMGRYHPQEPHWYLPFIGVDPARQGRGHGAALMEHALIPCDRDGTPAYLESSNPRNLPLYERHGFELLGTIQSGASPPIFPMLRKPR